MNNVTLVVLFFALINCAYSVFSTVLKAWFADADLQRKGARFLTNYSFLNIGWTIRAPIGTLLVMYSLQSPFPGWRPSRRTAARVYPFLLCRKAYPRTALRRKCQRQPSKG